MNSTHIRHCRLWTSCEIWKTKPKIIRTIHSQYRKTCLNDGNSELQTNFCFLSKPCLHFCSTELEVLSITVCNCSKALHACKCHQQLLGVAVQLPLWQWRGSFCASPIYSEVQLFSMPNTQNSFPRQREAAHLLL